MEAIGIIISFIWHLLCIPIKASETITFQPWQFFAFVLVLAIIINGIFGKKSEI